MKYFYSILLLSIFSISLYAQPEVEPNNRFNDSGVLTLTSAGPFIGTPDAAWTGDTWRLNLAPGTHSVDWVSDGCTRFRIVEYANDPLITQPANTPGASNNCLQILPTDECWLIDNRNIPTTNGMGSVSSTFTVVAGRFYYCFINPHMCIGTSFSSGGGLPVELLEFKGEYKNKGVKLEWTTLTEINNDKFDIEASTNSKEFIKVGEVQGSGNSDELINYNYSLNDFNSETAYYRLKQVDFDGKYEYSKIIAVDKKEKLNKVTVFPNPTNRSITVTNIPSSLKTEIRIVDLTGKIQLNQVVNSSFKNMTLESLDNGIYFLKVLIDDKLSHSEKIIKVK
jgi:hypothetical protein